ncbi:MAG: hydantoinase/oxoprolinase family protein [Desulfosalsimonadaceae bacterium]
MKTEKRFASRAVHHDDRRGKERTDYVVGIDTGGTYTDGVLMDYRSRQVLASGKTLTTREDLSIGVVDVLKSLNIRNPARVKLVGISSTLATNSIAEGKARDVGLILIGYDQGLVESFGLEEKFTAARHGFFSGGHTSQGEEQAPPDLEGIKAWVLENKEHVDAFAISGYFSPLDPSHEEAAFDQVRKVCDLPVVLGHQLSTKLDSIVRAATASLNASLVAVMQEFIEAVKTALAEQDIKAPLMIVKGDGSLMPYTEAVKKPVETILSGPAASAIGGMFFSREGNALMIDVGGTTTDIAFIKDGQIAISEEGARVGQIETAVKAARIRTACVGCDSRISFDQGPLPIVGPDRVVPLSRLAWLHPRIHDEIMALGRKKGYWVPADMHYWMFPKKVDAEELGISDHRTVGVVNVLNRGPASISSLIRELNVHHAVQLNADELFRLGLVEESTLTPSDLLHVNGKMDIWDVDAARQATACMCEIYGRAPATFVDEILDHIVSMIVEEAVVFLAGQAERNARDRLPESVDGRWGRWLLEESINRKDSYLSVEISSRFPIIGIGAPAGIFIKKVAKTLRAPFILPAHAHVANAAGAVAGSVVIEKEAILYTREREESLSYVVQIEDERTKFAEYDDAMAFARKTVSDMARRAAVDAGAADPVATLRVKTEGALERIQARAAGNPTLSDEK